jgi:4-alpha-glucanotransferase
MTGFIMNKRGSGILLHITSLPSPYGIGDLGPEAYRFVDFLAKARQSFWQVLPLNPINPHRWYSPYSSYSSLAGNPLLISPELLAKEGIIPHQLLTVPTDLEVNRIDYDKMWEFKRHLLDRAYEIAVQKGYLDSGFYHFCNANAHWLDDHALFVALKSALDEKLWNEWPTTLRDRDPDALEVCHITHKTAIQKEKFIQYIFAKQWQALRAYSRTCGVQIIGDLPIYVNHDSVDVWVQPHIFKLDPNQNPLCYAGVPPDRFSANGQLWHNPVYNWNRLHETGYRWWVRRFEHLFTLYDFIRIDHFRGFIAFWEVPVGKKTAAEGCWVPVPTDDFFNALFKHFSSFPVIVEDLGTITADVREYINRFGFPGTKVLLFAFDGNDPMHPYLPHMYPKNCMACTGTHDTNTLRGWLENEASEETKMHIRNYLGKETGSDIHWDLIRLTMLSRADLVLIPMQDVLGLGEETRMNNPGGNWNDNWKWRLDPGALSDEIAAKLGNMTTTYGRN